LAKECLAEDRLAKDCLPCRLAKGLDLGFGERVIFCMFQVY